MRGLLPSLHGVVFSPMNLSAQATPTGVFENPPPPTNHRLVAKTPDVTSIIAIPAISERRPLSWLLADPASSSFRQGSLKSHVLTQTQPHETLRRGVPFCAIYLCTRQAYLMELLSASKARSIAVAANRNWWGVLTEIGSLACPGVESRLELF